MNQVLRQTLAERRGAEAIAERTRRNDAVRARDAKTLPQQISDAVAAELDGKWDPAPAEEIEARIQRLKEFM